MPEPENGQVELSRIVIDRDVADGLKRLSKETGAPVQWHRRKAYELYLEQHTAPQK